MLSLVVSTVAFFIAAFFFGRWIDGMGIPRGVTRSLSVFALSAAVSYGVAYIVDLLFS